MQGLFRRAAASIVAFCLLAPQIEGVSFASPHHAPQHTAVALASPPQRIPVKEPVRTKAPALAMSALRPKTVSGVRAHGVHVDGPPMLRPNEIDRVISAARRRTPAAAPAKAIAPSVRTVPQPPSSGTRPGMRHALSLPSDPTASGTGINPWWRYQEQNVPGGGHVMVNVGTGNMLLQDDDMSVPHKGIALAFRRTYNSQSGHNVNATDAAGYVYEPAGMYGNGWTNTFDAHIARNSALTVYSVFDIDGARYDYDAIWPAGTNGVFTPRAGNHNTLVYDGVCGYAWTKKSGSTYYFYAPGPHAPCPQLGGSTEGYTGRLYQIVGRNRNTYLTFSYSWDSGVASLTGKVSQIVVQSESGMTATLTFADFNGHRLLQQLTFPDGSTAVQYGYDADGNLTTVSRPPNNAAGTRPTQGYIYETLGTGSVLQYATSPRWNGSDGGYIALSYVGSDVSSATLSIIGHVAVVNPSLSDGVSSGPLQSGYATGPVVYLWEYYQTGVTTPTFRDTDGHMTNWVSDGLGRPTQTQECTASASQGQQCTGNWLITGDSWDANNNLVSETDPRGYRTDYAYDANGNTIAVAQPQTTTYAQGTFRPTSLYSYDSYNNVTAYCDPNATHVLSLDWVSSPRGDSLCPITSTLATRFVWSTDPTQSGTASASPSYEPNGELLARIGSGTVAAPNGYRVNYTYDPSRQGGTDFGLPTTAAAATSISQADGSARQPTRNFWYDGNGNLGCYDEGNGAWVLGYDALGRAISTADPDDSAAGAGLCSKTSGTSGWSTAVTTTYYADGAVASKQTASQRAAGIATTFTYDLDGNETSETHHYGCTSTSSCTAGVTNKWYDGEDRLVEVSLPYDGNDIQGYPMMTRYVYDLSGGGSVPYQGLALKGYGGLVKTQEFLSGTVITPLTAATESSFTQLPSSSGSWADVRATSFDALDRALASYEAAFSSAPKGANTYDEPPSGGGNPQLGLLTSVALATNENKQYRYDELGRLTDTTYSNDGGATSPAHVRYDASGNVMSRGTDTLGTETYQYDGAGEKLSTTKPSSLGGVVIGYDYYADGTRKDLTFSSLITSVSPLYRYAYRADGRRSYLGLNNGSSFGWAYTAAGRLRTQSDPLTGTTVHPDNTYTIGHSQDQHPYYPASVTYGSETYSFDSFGRTTGVTLPAGMFSQAVTSFDFEDGAQAYSMTSVQAPNTVTNSMCSPSTIRNEKLSTFVGNATCGGRLYNGATFELVSAGAVTGGLFAAPPLPAPWTIDARSGMLLGWQGAPMSDGNTSTRRFTYDASGRLTGDTALVDRPATSTDPYNNGTRLVFNGTRTKTYDAENRLRSQQTTRDMGMGPLNNGVASDIGGYFTDTGNPSSWQLQAVDYQTDSHPARLSTNSTTPGD